MTDYKKVDTEMKSFDPVIDYKPPPKPFEDRDDRKERRNKAKEKRICVSLVILTFLASVCVLFGTLFPELSRGEIDMEKFRGLIQTAKRVPPHLVKDKITIVNLGLWRYCYDDQLYDLIEVINPAYTGRRRRSAEHSLEKRAGFNKMREGDLSIRCHSVPEPWKMPYHVKNKTEATKICLIVGIVMCIVSFLISILVLITRLPLLKLLQLLSCFLGALIIAVALGVSMTMQKDAEEYFNDSIGRKVEDTLQEEMGINLPKMGIPLIGLDLIRLQPGFCGILLGGSAFMMITSVIISEINRHH